jgi:hypothetical protein
MLGLRIATSAARLEARTGGTQQAGERLRLALARIGEDDDGPDLSAARALAGSVVVA